MSFEQILDVLKTGGNVGLLLVAYIAWQVAATVREALDTLKSIKTAVEADTAGTAAKLDKQEEQLERIAEQQARGFDSLGGKIDNLALSINNRRLPRI